jgi:hypothetical protein
MVPFLSDEEKMALIATILSSTQTAVMNNT